MLSLKIKEFQLKFKVLLIISILGKNQLIQIFGWEQGEGDAAALSTYQQ